MLRIGTVVKLYGLVRGSVEGHVKKPSRADPIIDRATDAQAKRDWVVACNLWREVVKLQPANINAWIQLGNMLNEMADYPAALKAFEQAIRRNPRNFLAKAGQAGVQERAGAWSLARDAWLHATKVATDDGQRAHAYAHAVLSAQMSGNPSDLALVTAQAVAALPDFIDRLADLPLRAKLIRNDHSEMAKHLLRDRLLQSPDDHSSRYEFASICLDDRKYFEGLAVLTPSLAKAEISPSFLWLEADLHERLCQWRRVLDACKRALVAAPTELRFVERAFEATVRLGDLTTARRYAIQFSSLTNGELKLIDRLRAAYESAGDLRRASLICRWLARRWPHSHWHLGHLIRLVAATSGLIEADKLTHRIIARHGRNMHVDAAYCHSAFAANEPAEAYRRFTWYLAGSGGDDLDSKVTLGYVLANSLGIPDAEQHFLTVAASNFQTKGALIGLAHMASRRRDQRATMECWARVSEMYPEDTIARVEHARSVYNYGDHDGARLLCEEAIKVLPSDTTMGEFYLWLLVATGDDNTAVAYLPQFLRFNGSSWDVLEAVILSFGRLGELASRWRDITCLLPSQSHAAASSRLYHITRLLMYFGAPDLAAALISQANINRKHMAWLTPYLNSGELTVAPTVQTLARHQWQQVEAQVTDERAQRLRSMSSAELRTLLRKPVHEQPRVHIVNKFEQPRGGSELHALDLADRLARHTSVELWAPEMPHPSFSAKQNVQAIDRSQGHMPYGGVLVFIGIYFPINWVEFARPDRIIFLYNTFEAPALYSRVREAASLTGVAVELLFCSDLIGAECGLPGLFEPSPIDIELFSASPIGSTPTRQKPFTLGRHSRDVMEKHHLEDKYIYQAVGQAGGQSVILGGTCMQSAFSNMPHLDLLPARTTGIIDYLRSLDLFYYRTSTWVEPWGRVVVEAMACEVPVLVHDIGGYAQIIRHGENGILFHTTQEAEAEVKRLQSEPALRRRLAKAGRSTVEELLGEESLARLTAFYMLTP